MKKLFVILFAVWIIIPATQAQDKTALIVIDIQDFYFPGGNVPLSGPEEAAENAFRLINNFREADLPVIFVRHNYEPGGSINDIVLPLEGERIISKSEVSSFNGTDLDPYLKELGVSNIVICGMQTHMCVEAATRAGYDLGYKCTLVEDACATRDLKYGDKLIKAADVHYSTLSTLKSYATVLTTEEFLNN